MYIHPVTRANKKLIAKLYKSMKEDIKNAKKNHKNNRKIISYQNKKLKILNDKYIKEMI